MKALLIYPPDWQVNFVEVPGCLRHSDSRSRIPPLGLLCIAAHLMANTDHEVEVIDYQLLPPSYDAIEERIRQFGPDVVGITVWTSSSAFRRARTRLTKTCSTCWQKQDATE